jgi:ABC-2 type transport system permease protein
MLLQYRAAAAAGIITQIVFGWIRVMVFEAFYASATSAPPMTLAQTVTYVWLSQALLRMVPWLPDWDVRQMIRSGSVAFEMVRPVRLYSLWYARSVASLTAPTLLRSVPMFVLAFVLFGMGPPASAASALAFVASLACALVLCAAFSTLLTITCLWTISGDGIMWLMMASVWLFSGMIIPLPLFPDWLQPVFNALPFRGMIDLPFRLYMGHIPAVEIGAVIAVQVAWAAGLVLAGRMLLARGVRRLVVQGG